MLPRLKKSIQENQNLCNIIYQFRMNAKMFFFDISIGGKALISLQILKLLT